MASAELETVLARVRQGERSALEELVTLLYPELRRRAAQYLRRERRGHTLQPTALVNEAYLRLFRADELEWNDRAHFLAAMAQQMRRILVDYARARNARKRPGAQVRVELKDVADVQHSLGPAAFGKALSGGLSRALLDAPLRARVVAYRRPLRMQSKWPPNRSARYEPDEFPSSHASPIGSRCAKV